jgi:hypothetical protein
MGGYGYSRRLKASHIGLPTDFRPVDLISIGVLSIALAAIALVEIAQRAAGQYVVCWCAVSYSKHTARLQLASALLPYAQPVRLPAVGTSQVIGYGGVLCHTCNSC